MGIQPRRNSDLVRSLIKTASSKPITYESAIILNWDDILFCTNFVVQKDGEEIKIGSFAREHIAMLEM